MPQTILRMGSRGGRTMTWMPGASVHRRMSLPHLGIALSTSTHASRAVWTATQVGLVTLVHCAMHVKRGRHLLVGPNHCCTAMMLQGKSFPPLSSLSLGPASEPGPRPWLTAPEVVPANGHFASRCCPSRRHSTPSHGADPPQVATEDPVNKRQTAVWVLCPWY